MSVSTRSFGSWLRRYSLVLVAALGGAAGVAYAAGWHQTPAPAARLSVGPGLAVQLLVASSGKLPADTVQDTVQIALLHTR